MSDVNLCHKKTATLPIVIVDFILMVIKMVTMEEVDIGLNIPDKLPLAIMDQELMLTGEVDIGMRTATIPPVT